MSRMIGFGIFLLAMLTTSMPAAAANLVIYDDQSENGFNDSCTFGAAPNFAEFPIVHSGTQAISFDAAQNGAISWCTPGSLSTTNYSGITFWVNGGGAGGQDLELVFGLASNIAAQASLDTLLGHAIAAGAWEQVTVSFDSGPIQFNGNFDQISIQDNSGSLPANPQPTVYFDDVSLTGRASGPDWIFKSGFEGSSLPPPPCGMTDEHDVSVLLAPGDTMVSDRFSWCDSANKPRVAVLAHNDQTGANAGVYANHGGALQRFSYELSNNTTRNATVTTYGNGGYGGFGYVVSHTKDSYCNGDDSPLGYSFAGTWTRVFEGRHHAIFRFQQNYQRHCGPNPSPPTTLVPVTIDWIFSTGHDHPLWAITYDMSAIAANFLNDDSRAPYGELNIDGTGFTDIDGVAWGDKYKFTSTAAPVTLSSTWTWNVANTVPYVKEWIVSTDATMGLVQTQTIVQQDAGGARTAGSYPDLTQFWNKTSANGNACNTYPMPCQDGWPYQANNDSIGTAPNSNNNARLTWGTQYGFLGQTTYASNLNAGNPDHGPNLPGWPKKSYSVYVVLGPHSASPVEAQVTQVETAQNVSLSINGGVGTVPTGGPAGVNRADTVSYVPAGYNHVYGALAFAASAGNQLDATVAVGSGTLKKPLLILSNYAGAYPTSVKLNGTTLTVDVDYFPSMRAGSDELWITFNQDFSGATNHIQITP